MKTKHWLLLVLWASLASSIVGAKLGIRQERRREAAQQTLTCKGDVTDLEKLQTCLGEGKISYAPPQTLNPLNPSDGTGEPVTPQALNPIQK